MSHNSTINVVDEHDVCTLYAHDLDPDEAEDLIHDALRYAWPLPRFEANDFAAAIIRAGKHEGGGDLYLDNPVPMTAKSLFGRSFGFEVRQQDDGLILTVRDAAADYEVTETRRIPKAEAHDR